MRASWDVDGPDAAGVHVVVRDEIDLDVAEDFRRDIGRWLADGHAVDLDLGAVTFMDSAGLRSLMRLHLDHGGAMRIGRVSDTVARLFDVAGVSALLRGPGGDAGHG